MGRFGVTASAVREAERILEAEGLVAVRRGSQGGTVVRHPEGTTAAYMMTLVLRSRGAELRDIFQARVHMETLCAELCARRPDRRKTVVPRLRALHATTQQMDRRDPSFVPTMSLFHQILVQHCGSESITLIAGVVETIANSNIALWAHEAAGTDNAATLASKAEALEYHEEICELINEGRDARVRQVMSAHSADMCLVERWFSGIDLSVPVDATVVRSAGDV
jgi:DNA-binding FadR family transcriptional regulator